MQRQMVKNGRENLENLISKFLTLNRADILTCFEWKCITIYRVVQVGSHFFMEMYVMNKSIDSQQSNIIVLILLHLYTLFDWNLAAE